LPFALATFVAAFLLFQAQPLIAKLILPWFGGAAAVWTTCMLFFQLLLLAGYAYVHFVIRRLRPRAQVLVHVALLLAAASQLPIVPDDAWKPLSGDSPFRDILVLLTASIALPYLVLSSTTPLMQSWLAIAHPGVSPYRLFALSNFGSLLALLTFSFIAEPTASLRIQAGIWMLGFAVFALSCGGCAWRVWTRRIDGRPAHATSQETPVDDLATRFLWLALPACATVLLLAITNQITKDLVVPFLWVLPLALYLLSFVISFADARFYPRWLYMSALAPVMVVVLATMARPMATPVLQQVGVYCTALFVCCMICHGELNRLKPPVQRLTGFYLMIALGGALGGVLVACVAPVVFPDYFELHAGLLGVCALALVALYSDRRSVLHAGRPRWGWGLLVAGYLGFALSLYVQAGVSRGSMVAKSRNFYGVLSVVERLGGSTDEQRWLYHGATPHGVQFSAPNKRRLGTGYYSARSGAGLALRYFRRNRGRRIGLVGLGVGTLTTFSTASDSMRVYEIDPNIRHVAEEYFDYLANAPGEIDIVMGDARLSLERESAQAFDLLLIDAFSGDAIPVHLLTKEAFEIYLRHVSPGGVIGVLIDTDHLDFGPVLYRLASHFGLQAARITTPAGPDQDWGADWMLMTRERGFLDTQPIAAAAVGASPSGGRLRLWTDDYTSVLPLFAAQ